MLIVHDSGASRLRRALDLATLVAGGCALALLVLEFGFPLAAGQRNALTMAVRIVLWAVVAMQIVRGATALNWRRGWRHGVGSLAVYGGLILLLALEGALVPRLAESLGGTEDRWTMVYLTTLHVAVLVLLVHRLLNFNQLLAFAHISPRIILIGSYLALIVLGTFLLKLPNATIDPLPWLDALFTSTSAVCVTGLIVVDTATAFTTSGQGIILLLFQLGGLGLMTFTYFFVFLFGSGITLKDRALLLEFLNEDNVGRITGTLIAIVAMTLAFEAVGALLLWHLTPGSGWFASVFHAVSAFCNAGFSVFSDGMYDSSTRSNATFQVVIMTLIVVGGLGFPVLRNLWEHLDARLLRRWERAPRLTAHTKIVLTTTAALIVAGAALIYAFEKASGVGGGGTGGVLAAVFSSITARTAGFNTIPIDALTTPAVLVVIVLMFIGGSPASTAGGIKTTTFAVALLNTLRILRDASRELVAFERQIPSVVATRAFAVALLAAGWVSGTTIVLTWLMPDHPPLDVAFEAVSAFATVGLSRGLTGDLPAMGKVVVIASMLVGRIGILYVALGILRQSRPGRIGYPEGNVIIS